jgi:hypothetical protein
MTQANRDMPCATTQTKARSKNLVPLGWDVTKEVAAEVPKELVEVAAQVVLTNRGGVVIEKKRCDLGRESWEISQMPDDGYGNYII